MSLTARAGGVRSVGALGISAAAWWALVGLLALYVPVYLWAARVVWMSDDHAHGPIVLAVVAWLFWTLRAPLAVAPGSTAPRIGWPLFVLGLLSYLLGRALEFSIFMFGSQLMVVAGLLLLLTGVGGLRLAWFPVFYLLFMIPLPGVLVDALTGPLKQWISAIVETLLYTAGYPIARSGVVLTIGQYQMLVADACSGLHSMFSLTALGTLFMYLMARKAHWHNAVMLAAILPIAFVANVVRVIILLLVTYYLGDEAGQGFLHGTAGMVLMGIALFIFIALDAALVALGRRKPATGA